MKPKYNLLKKISRIWETPEVEHNQTKLLWSTWWERKFFVQSFIINSYSSSYENFCFAWNNHLAYLPCFLRNCCHRCMYRSFWQFNRIIRSIWILRELASILYILPTYLSSPILQKGKNHKKRPYQVEQK